MSAPLDLDAIEKRAEKATGGEWRACRKGECICGMVWAVTPDVPIAAALSHLDEGYTAGEGVRAGSPTHQANMAFIAAARSDVPSLCVELRAARAERDVLREALNKFRTLVEIAPVAGPHGPYLDDPCRCSSCDWHRAARAALGVTP